MCSDVAVRWSNYESAMTVRDSETKHKVAEEIQEYIDRCRETNQNNHFIAGLELARSIVLGLTKPSTKANESLDNVTLF